LNLNLNLDDSQLDLGETRAGLGGPSATDSDDLGRDESQWADRQLPGHALTNHFELDLGQGEPVSRPLATTPKGQDRWQRIRLWLGPTALIALVVFGVGAIHLSGESDDPLQNVQLFIFNIGAMVGLEKSNPDLSFVAQPETLPKIESQAPMTELLSSEVTVLEALSVQVDNEEVFRNPYWYLSNPLEAHPQGLGRPMTGRDEETYRKGLNHEYVYQAYRVVRLMRSQRLQGAERVLIDAINHQKFWTRMEAIIALAEFGFEINIDTVERAIANVDPYLVAHYFKRSLAKPSPGALYVLKQAIRLADAPGRLMVLKVLSAQGWHKHGHYLAAATLDQSPMIQTWIQEELEHRPLSGMTLAAYQAAARDNYRSALTTVDQPTQVIEVKATEETIPQTVEFFGHETSSSEPQMKNEAPELTDENLAVEAIPYDDGFESLGGSMVSNSSVIEVKDADTDTDQPPLDSISVQSEWKDF
jgi:hypothetical protein